MYLTAQLVRNDVRGWEGVNAFLYNEPAHLEALPQPPTARAIVQAVDQYASTPRTPSGSIVVVPPGGNAVMAYLDVVVGGPIPLDSLDKIEQDTRDKLKRDDATETVAWASEGFLVRAYVRPGLNLDETLRRLALSAREIVTNPRLEQPPITILELHRSDGFTFAPDEPSKSRLRALHGDRWEVPQIGISYDNRSAFEAMHGNLYEHLMVAMTGGLETAHLARLGGIQFVDESGRVIWPVGA